MLVFQVTLEFTRNPRNTSTPSFSYSAHEPVPLTLDAYRSRIWELLLAHEFDVASFADRNLTPHLEGASFAGCFLTPQFEGAFLSDHHPTPQLEGALRTLNVL